MTLQPPFIAAIGIDSIVGVGVGAGILEVEASRNRRKEAHISTV